VLNGVMRTLTCFDPKSGDVHWVGDLSDNKRFWASPSIAEGKMYLVDENGGVVVASIGEKFEILSRGDFGGRPNQATPALVDGKVLIRTTEKLICIGS
jgi:hypothetical protein